ncbi:MAG: apolipoprotein N-acyltransferase [Alphaproteobacteria bacterium]|nr:apolipoprotein N-acyltransferase [Alphaproteobacteria bacterium]
MAIYSGLATAIVWKLYHKKDPAKYAVPVVLSFVILWTLAEWLRGHLFTGFPWNLAGYSWGFSDVMLQTSAIWGIYGLGFITIFLALVPYLLIYGLARPKFIYTTFGTALVIIGAMIFYGRAQLSTPTKFRNDVKLEIVQTNISQKDKWDPTKKSGNFVKYLEMSKSDPAAGITAVIWPETAVIYFLDTEPSRRYLIAQMLNKGEVLMTGFPRLRRQPTLKVWNSFAVIDNQSRIRNIYDKHHLVPFGEYTPDIFRKSLSFLGLGMFAQGLSYSAGTGPKTLHPPGMPPVGVLICYEVIFPGAVVDRHDRPDWLLNITNDAWYGSFSEPYQHLLQTRVRAIEEGLPIIRSAGTGISAVIDAYGRVIKSLKLNRQGVIISRLPVKKAVRTPYSRNSGWIFVVLVILLSTLNIFIVWFQRP